MQFRLSKHLKALKKAVTLLFALFAISTASAQQFVVKKAVKEPLAGLCDSTGVYDILQLPDAWMAQIGNKKAICPISKVELRRRLLLSLSYLKDKPSFSDQCTISFIINCSGEAVHYEVHTSSKNKELEQQILRVINSLGLWEPASVQGGQKVDSFASIGFKVDRGLIVVDASDCAFRN